MNGTKSALPPKPRVKVDVRYPGEDNPKQVDLEADGALTVKVRANLKNILKIDQVQETFTARFVVEFRYIDPALKNFESEVAYMDNGKFEAKKGIVTGMDPDTNRMKLKCDNGDILIALTNIVSVSQPDWSSGKYALIPVAMTNMVGAEEMVVEKRKLEYCSEEGGHVSFFRKVQATFFEQFELNRMPFDRQVLRIKFSAEESLVRMQYVPEKDYCTITKNNTNSCPLPIEWKFGTIPGKKEPAEMRVFKMQSHPSVQGQWARFEVMIHVERRPWFYIWNVFGVLCFITLSSAITFAVEKQDVADRASVLFAILLTTVGYKLIITSWLPIKPYLTFLDQYILFCFLVQFVAIAENMLVAMVDIEARESYFWAPLYILWIVCHICFVCVLCLKRSCFYKPWSKIYKDNNAEPPDAVQSTASGKKLNQVAYSPVDTDETRAGDALLPYFTTLGKAAPKQ